jgi:hypothetical protein
MPPPIKVHPWEEASEAFDPGYRLSAQPTSLEWETPGIFLANALQTEPAVRYVFERAVPDGWSILVLLSDDSASTADKVFEAESALYSEFPKARIDVRVTKIEADKAADALAKDHYRCHLAQT